MSSPRRYAVPQRSAEYYTDINGGRRISKRQAVAAGFDYEEVVAKMQKVDYEANRMAKATQNKAEVAEWNPLTVKPCEDEDREELLFDPEQFRHIDEKELQKFRAAAHDKLGADTHDSMVHLQSHRYNIKEALETIDAIDSVPNAGICGPNGTGYWTPEELENFITQWNQMRKYKWETKNIKLLEIKQMFPQKTNAKFFVNRLQMFFCEKLNEKKRVPDQFCEKKARLAQMERGIRSANCTNCVNKLWMKPVEEYPEVLDLCELCKLYDSTFVRMRPNAAVTPKVFQFGQLNPCKCESLENPTLKKATLKKTPPKKATITPEIFNIKPLSPSVYDFALEANNEECIKTLRKCLNKDILAIKGANISALFEGLVGSSMSSAVMNLAASVKADDTYVFVCCRDIRSLSAFPRFDFGVSSAVGSNENADPIETKKLESLQLCWNLHAHSKKMLSFASIQKTFRLEEHEVKDEWRKEFEAGKAGGPEPDCMLYGTIGANGRITPGTDATFAEYFDRVSA